MAELSSLWRSEGQAGDYGRVCVMIEVTESKRPLLLSGSHTRHRSAAPDTLCGGSYSGEEEEGVQSTTNRHIYIYKKTGDSGTSIHTRTYTGNSTNGRTA